MPELNASGDVFTLDARAGFDEGIVRGRVGSSARLPVEAQFALCHGLNAALTAQAVAEVEAGLTLLWLLAGRAEGQALAAAGLKVDARITVDLFDTIGLSAEVAAFAEASLAGQLSIGLDLTDIARLARSVLSDVAYDIFIAFLNETRIAAGVWGKVSVAAMAQAHLNVRGSLRDDDEAGFVVEFGADAGLGAGAGYEMYVGIGLENPKRFFLYAAERITTELSTQARELLPPYLHPAVTLLDLALPITLNAAYELGQTTALQATAPSSQLFEPFIANVGAQLQRLLLDRLVEVGVDLLAQTIRDALPQVGVIDLSASERAAIRADIQGVIADLEAGQLSVATVGPLLDRLTGILEQLLPELIEEWRAPSAIVWCALIAAAGVRDAIGSPSASASASASMVGLGSVAAEAQHLTLPEPPRIVHDELERYFAVLPPRLELHQALDYLVGTGVASLIDAYLPDLALLLDLLERHTGITRGSLIEAALAGTFGGGIAATDFYQRLRAFLKDALDGYVLADILPELRALLGTGDDALLWIDEVAEPSLLLLSGFVFEQLDKLATGMLPTDDATALRGAMSNLAGKIVVRNVVVISDILVSHVIAELSSSLRTLETAVRSDPTHILATAGLQLVPALLPPLMPLPPNLTDPTRALVAELCGAGADAYGSAVWTRDRRERLRGLLMRLLLSVDGDVEYQDSDAARTFFIQLAECAYIPDPDGLLELNELFIELFGAHLEVLLPRVTSALHDFFLAVTYAGVVAMDDAARAFIDGVAAFVQAAWDEFQRWRGIFDRAVADTQAAARLLSDRIDAAAALLRDPAQRGLILDRLLLNGIAGAEVTARATPGFDLLAPDLQDAAVVVATGGFVVAFNLVRPLLDVALESLSVVADNLADLIDAAADLPDLFTRLRDDIDTTVRDTLAAMGIILPSELSIQDVADAAKDLLVGLTALRAALALAIAQRTAVRTAERAERDAQTARDAARSTWEDEQARHAALLGGPIGIEIVSPAALSDALDESWAYGVLVPLRISVAGARPSFVQADAPRRILLAVNGEAIAVPAADWTYDTARHSLDLATELRAVGGPLRPGLNTLECSVADGLETVARVAVVFAVNPRQPLAGQVVVVPELSLFDTAGDDHEHTRSEQVTLRNLGTIPVQLRDWRLADRARHRFRFPDCELLPGLTVSIYTGSGTNTDTDLYWGRRQAIWNNRGDTVYLIQPDGVIHHEYVY